MVFLQKRVNDDQLSWGGAAEFNRAVFKGARLIQR
jgi:hypothetical protein